MFKARNIKNPGMTLLELTVAVTIMAFIFGFTGFLVFMSSRNMVNLRDQITSQNSASAANERLAASMRNASQFAKYTGDSGTLYRIQLAPPLSGGTTGALCYDPRPVGYTPAATYPQAVMYFANSSNLTFSGTYNGIPLPVGTPSFYYDGVSSFSLAFQSQYWLTLTTRFQYRGFALYFQNPGNPQYGQFITDVVAKNHYMDDGVNNYAAADTTTSPATL